jgi:hypothetical protein
MRALAPEGKILWFYLLVKKVFQKPALYQGTTSVVPQLPPYDCGL